MRKPICVPASVHLCTPSICPKQPDMEVQGKGESKGCLHQAGLCSGCAGHGSMCSISKEGGWQRNSPLPPQHHQGEAEHEACSYLLPHVSGAEHQCWPPCGRQMASWGPLWRPRCGQGGQIFHFLKMVCSHFFVSKKQVGFSSR